MPTARTRFPNLREHLNADYESLSDSRLEAALARQSIDAESAEGFFDNLGKTLLSVAPSILPVAGTVLGTAFGGPVGASIGGALGRFAGSAIGGATQQPSGGAPPAPGGMPPPVGGSPAAGQLLQTIARPETLNALMSMLLGSAGKPNVDVGATAVPVGAFTNLLGALANKAASEYNEATAAASEGIASYLTDYAGESIADAAIAEHRAAALYELIRATPLEYASEVAERGAAWVPAASESWGESAEWELQEILETLETE